MIQILIKHNDRFSLSEMAQMAIEAQIMWIVLDVNSSDGIREELAEITDMCSHAGIILTCTDAGVAKEYGIHGVFIDDCGSVSPFKLREEFGPEAIIGALVASADSAFSLVKADIDYVALDEGASDAVLHDIRKINTDYPVVAMVKGVGLDYNLKECISKGYSGVCLPPEVFLTADPVHLLRSMAGDI